MLRHSNNCKLVHGVIRSFVSTSWLSANHYDVLEITPKATQNDIKSAYYKLSKIYHPDKSNDEASAKKFRSITEAYEVLGNIKLKKMYDKGLLTGRENTTRMHYQPEPEPVDPTLKFYKSRTYRHITPTIDGKTPIYDFDSWSKNHYGEVFKKSQYEKQMLKKKRKTVEQTDSSNRQEALIYLIFMIGGMFTILVINGRADFDTDEVSHRKRVINTDNDGK